MLRCFVVFLAWLSIPIWAAAESSPAVKLLDIDSPLLSEMSGLAKSRRYPEVYWAHNDSGDEARLFPLDASGRLLMPHFLGDDFYTAEPAPGKELWPGLAIRLATNIDWEDIATDGDYLYIADTGNNGNARRDLGVYIVAEPNPREIPAARMLRHVPLRYPGQTEFPARQWHYDSEAIFVDRGRLYFLTKHRVAGRISEFEPGTYLYRLDEMSSDKVNVLKQIDARLDLEIVTGAELSPEGDRLAVLCWADIWLFESPRRGDRWLSGKAYRVALDRDVTGQVEAITWQDNNRLLVGNEGGEWFSVDADRIPEVGGTH